MMDLSHASFERSITRSSVRLRVLIMLSSLGEAFPRQLAKACDIDCWRLNAVMHGNGADYSHDFALVALGLAEVGESRHGSIFRITQRGRRKARQLTARAARRDRFRAMIREERGGATSTRVWPRAGEPVYTGAATPASPPLPTASFAWSLGA